MCAKGKRDFAVIPWIVGRAIINYKIRRLDLIQGIDAKAVKPFALDHTAGY